MSPATEAITRAAIEAMSSAGSSGSPSVASDAGLHLPPPSQQQQQQRQQSITGASLLASAAVLPPLPTPAGRMSLPGGDFYLPSFHEYDRRQYDLATNPEMRRQVRLSSLATSLSGLIHTSDPDDAAALHLHADGADTPSSIPPALLATAANLDPARQAELRRQIHIQSEQKRRAQIKDGFDDLRRQLPNCHSKKLSKAVILSRTTVYLQQLKQHALTLQAEVERLAEENARLRRASGLPDDDAARKVLDAAQLFPL
jgi:hypothetical protein